MREELEVFENRSDDWLAKERKYEETVSVWDFDEAKKIKIEHEDNCESYEIKKEHEIKHSAYNNSSKNKNNLVDYQINQKKLLLTLVLCFITIPMIVIGIIIETNGRYPDIIMAVPIISLIIMVNFIKKMKGRKK